MTDVIIVTQAGQLTVNEQPEPQALVTPAASEVVHVDRETVLVNTITQRDQAQVATLGPQGPAGNGAVVTASSVAAEAINTGAVVASTATGYANADANNPALASVVVGIATTSGLAGAQITAQTEGPYDNPNMNLTPGLPVYLGLNGAMTQAVNVGTILRQIGVALLPTRVLIQIGTPIQRG